MKRTFPKVFLLLVPLFFLATCTPKSEPHFDKGPYLNFQNLPTPQERQEALSFLREKWQDCLGNSSDKKNDNPLPLPKRWLDFQNPVRIQLWDRGKKLFSANSQNQRLAKAFPSLIDQACRRLKKLDQEGLDPQTQITLAYDIKGLTPEEYKKNRRRFSRRFGLWGLVRLEKGRMRWWLPSDYLERNYKLKELFAKVCGKGLTPKDCVQEKKGALYTFEVFDFISLPLEKSYTNLYRLAPLVPFESVQKPEALSRLALMRKWYLNNLMPSGRMTYIYRPSFDKVAQRHNNMIRQWMTTLAMFRLAKFQQDAELLAAAEKNLAYNIKEYMRTDEARKIAYVYFRNKAKLGSAAFALLSVLESKDLPQRDKLIAYLKKFILDQQESNGAFRTFFLPPQRNDNQNFYPGEALLALMTLYESDPKAYGEILPRVQKAFEYYRTFFIKRPNPAFVPWHTMALHKLYQRTKNPEVAEFIFEMNDFLLEIQNTPDQLFTPEPDTLGRFYDPKKSGYGPPHASSTAVYSEGLVDALALAVTLKDEKRSFSYALAIHWGLRSLFQLQYTPENTFWIGNKKATVGALHTTVVNNNLRVDNTQHATMALLNLLKWPELAGQVFKPQSQSN